MGAIVLERKKKERERKKSEVDHVNLIADLHSINDQLKIRFY